MRRLILISSLLCLPLDSCNIVNSYSLGEFFIQYAPAGHCPELAISNYGPDDVSFLTGSKSSVLVRVNGGSPLWPIIGSDMIGGAYAIQGGTVRDGEPYRYDIGLKCSPSTPELRQTYDVYSIVTLTEDPATPTGLSVSVAARAR